MAARLDGRVAIVTGASRGIGLAIAHRLVDEGACVVITARKEEALRRAAAELGGERVAWVSGAGDDRDHQAAAIGTALNRFGRLDILVNNTGINPAFGPLIDMDLDVGTKIFAVNVLAAVSWVQKAYAAWMRERGGAVVNVASVAGLRPAPNIGLYGASKSALIHVTQELAIELAPTVRVNAVAPAVVKTRFAAPLYEGREEDVVASYPVGRLGAPEDVAGSVAFLVSDDAAWITGRTMVLDGGLTLIKGTV